MVIEKITKVCKPTYFDIFCAIPTYKQDYPC